MKNLIQKYSSQLILGIILLFLLIGCIITSKYINRQITHQAVLNSEINTLQSEIDRLLSDTVALHKSNDSLHAANAVNLTLLSQYKSKYAQKAAELQTELSKLNKESDTSSVRRFLDETGNNQVQVVKYDSLYLIPANAAKKSNIERAELSNQFEINGILRAESEVKSIIIKNLNMENSNKDAEINRLTIAYDNSLLIQSKLKDETKSEHKKYKVQKVKTWIVGGVGAVLLVGSVVL